MDLNKNIEIGFERKKQSSFGQDCLNYFMIAMLLWPFVRGFYLEEEI